MRKQSFPGVVFLLWLCNLSVAQPSDKEVTRETAQLFNNLEKIAGKGFLFGHQDALAYGVNWRYKDNRSDVQEVTGDYPGIYGWDLGGIERANGDNNIDGIPFKKNETVH